MSLEFQDTELGRIPSDWAVKEAFDFRPFITSGSRGWARFYSETGSAFIRITNLSHDDIYPDLSDLKFVRVEETDPEAVRTKLKKGDVLISITADIGAIGYVGSDAPEPAYINQHIACLRLPSELVNSHYVAYFLCSYVSQRRFQSMVDVGAKSGLNLTAIGKLKLLIPPLAEQKAIANALSDADALIESLEKLIAKKRLIKTSLLQKFFTPQEEWQTLKLGECATLKARIGWQGLTTAEYLNSGSFGLITGTDFKGGKIDWNNCHYVTKDRYDQDRNIQIKENDVLVTKDGTIGKIAFIGSIPQPTTLNSGVFVVRPIGNSFDPKCFYYLLSSHHFDEFLGQLAAGSTISHLYQKDFVHFSFKLPDLSKQQEIGSALFELDFELAKHEERLTKARLLKQGMMQELLTGRIRLI